MKKDLTELVFILDKSGSMYHLTQDTIGGFNSTVEKQKSEAGEALVTTVLFSDTSVTVHDRQPLAEIPLLTEKEYSACGCTALLDAVGSTIARISDIQKHIRPEDVPEKTMFVIITDGMENASREYTLEGVRKLIEEKKESGWEFVFFGANIDAIETAASMGINRKHARNYHADKEESGMVFSAASKAISFMRKEKLPLDNCCCEWSAELDSTYRKKQK